MIKKKISKQSSLKPKSTITTKSIVFKQISIKNLKISVKKKRPREGNAILRKIMIIEIK